MSRKCIIEKYLHQLNFSDDKFIVMADDFKMIADLALKQLAISKTETTSDPCEWCDKTLMLFTKSGKYIPENQPPRNYCPNCGRRLED